MPGWEIALWGHTLALDNFIPLFVGVGFFLVMGVYPFIEAWVTGDNRTHNVLDRPRNRRVRTGLGAAWISFYAVALIGAANDIIALRLHVSVNAVTWTVRIGLFVVPVVVYSVAKRFALALQLSDREKVLHGRETGIIKRLPHGEFVEVHEPLDQAHLYVLTQHEQYRPIEPGSGPDAGGPDSAESRAERLRERLSRRLYGEGTQIAKPTVREYQEEVSHD
jgi:ubiquinol-cytochrome c reductase cytochrome b subunit